MVHHYKDTSTTIRMTSVSAMLTIAIVTICITGSLARPHNQYPSRERRSGISDQRLAELETLMALARLRGHNKAVTRPIAFGLIDPSKIGRRRKRSFNFQDDTDLLFVVPEMVQHPDEVNSETSNDYPEFGTAEARPVQLGSMVMESAELLPNNQLLSRFSNSMDRTREPPSRR